MAPSFSFKLGARPRNSTELKERLSKEDSAAAREEMGIPSVARPSGPLVWFHAETEAKAQPLAKVVRQLSDDWPRVNFLLTSPRKRSGTPAINGFPKRCIHQYAPADDPEFYTAFFENWAPDIGVFAGIDTASNLPQEANKREIPLFLAGANFDKGMTGGLRGMMAGKRKELRALFENFAHIDAVDAATVKELTGIGISSDKLRIAGPISEVSATLPCVEDDRQTFATAIRGRPVWLASNVASEEDNFVLAAHLQASRTAHRLLLIHVPDTPQRGEALAENLTERGLRVCLRSRGELPDEETQVFVADSDGEMGLWYRLATVTFLGNSFIATGNVQSPYEAAGLGSAILHGPNVRNYLDAFSVLDAQGGASGVARGQELGTALLGLLPPDRAAAMAHVAWEITTSGAQATDLALTRIEDMLDEIGAY